MVEQLLPRHSDNSQILEILEAVQNSLRNRRLRIVVHGDVMLDEYLSGDVERISPEAPIPVLAGRLHHYRPGGAANVAANLASLGAAVDVIGIIGVDEPAERLKQVLDEASVNTQDLVQVSGRQTTRKLRVVSGSQQIVRIDFEETEPPTGQDALRLTETASRLIDDADALIISDYNKGACSQRVLSDIIAYARSRKVTVLCDPKGTNYGKYAGANIITPNRKEASAAAGIHMPDSVEPGFAARKLRKELGLEACLVTLGPDGMLLSEAGNDHEIHAFSHDVADVTGAGDCVIAGLAIALACGLPYLQSCIFANAVASISVSKAGSVAVNIDEVIAKYANALRRSTSTLIPRSQAGAEIAKWKDSGNSIVFTNGCFDILHAGHVLNLSHCATLGSRLVVGLNSDRSVRALKGTGRPVNSAEDRAAVLLALESVDAVIVFDEETPEELIRTVRPDVLVKGADYAEKEVVGRTFVESYGGRVELVEFERDISTTAILEKMKVSQK